MEKIDLIDVTDILYWSAGCSAAAKQTLLRPSQLKEVKCVQVSAELRKITLTLDDGDWTFKDEPEAWAFLNKYFNLIKPKKGA